MAFLKYHLVYRNFQTGELDASHSMTIQAKTPNACIRKAVTQATTTGTPPDGYSLVEVKWVPFVPVG